MNKNLPTLEQRLKEREKPSLWPILRQNWEDFLFLHFECPVDVIQRTLPKGLYVDTFNNKAFIGLIPFFVSVHRPCYFFSIPGLSSFYETNVRTYVYDEKGHPGIWFYSLSANSAFNVYMARHLFNLPYVNAEMHVTKKKELVDYRILREHVSSRLIYEPEGGEFVAKPGTLDFFLLERYALFITNKKGELKKGRVYHEPYLLRNALVSEYDQALIELDGFQLDNTPVHQVCSTKVKVQIYPLQAV